MTSWIRSALLVLVTTLAMLVALLPLPAHADTTADTPAARAARWLMAQSTNGTLPNATGETDWGLTTDAIIGLHTAGATTAQLRPFLDALDGAVRNGRYGYLGSSRDVDAGSLAKVLHIANLTGRNPRSFGGEDLVADVQAQVTNGHLAGANAFGQSYAILGLRGAGQNTSALVSRLAAQQCPAGDFRLALADTACTTAASRADRDATAIALTALRAAGGPAAATNRATVFLAQDQRANGSWIGSPGTTAANTNTTGLAARALHGNRPLNVALATGFTVSLQLTTGADAGAVAYDTAAFGRASGGSISTNRTQWTRATAQALLALVHFDVYTTPGTHTVNGRQWRTACEPYSQTGRCRTEIWATTVQRVGSAFVQSNGWVFNNLTYLPGMTRQQWAGNNLANAPAGTSKNWTGTDGRRWRTECDTAVTGRHGCRAWAEADVVSVVGGTYRVTRTFTFNNLVRFKQ